RHPATPRAPSCVHRRPTYATRNEWRAAAQKESPGCLGTLAGAKVRGLEEYEAAFRDNKINEQVLPSLTQEDLKEIGVGPVGHRRILLDAIAAHANTAAPLVADVVNLRPA